ncbi:MAG: ABC transporter ATP-binding protein [Alphaproteobacteria bacterium]|nr:ABC transporter ATP-binding protein [Alphaproteobacteria bacterium]
METAGGAVGRVDDRRGDVLVLEDVAKTYRPANRKEIVAVSPTNLRIRDGEFVSLVGPSGCGKTTLLNLISGLILPSAGRILFNGRPTTGPTGEMSLVFQRPVLLPWRRIIDNVMLPVQVMRLKPQLDYEKRARDLLALVGLGGFEDAYPRELSGGMQQRAAIARALVYDTRVLLMDEPFAALDAMTREELNIELMRIWEVTGRTIVFVTHNIAEAVLLSDRIVVMTARPGKVREVLSIDIPRPRSLDTMGDRRFGEISNHIRGMLHNKPGDASHSGAARR